MSGKSKREKKELADKEMLMLKNASFKRKIENKTESETEILIKDIKNFSVFSKILKTPDSFVSKTKSKNLDNKKYEMIKHLFVKYPVPKILENIWFIEYWENQDHHRYYHRVELKENDVHKWFVCVATGGSLHKEFFSEFFTKKETAVFINCNKKLFYKEALYYAICIAEGASESVALMIAKSKIQRESYTSPFWKNCAKFFAKNPPKSKNEMDDLVDFLRAKYNQDHKYSIYGKGLNVETLVKRMNDWHYELRRYKHLGNHSWKPEEYSNVDHTDKDTNYWTLSQITTGKELCSEGTAMHHCVSSYLQRCKLGYCSIWSLKINGKRAATIEAVKGKIVQARGYANRDLKKNEQAALKKLTEQNNLAIHVKF